jgi:hypothetical protein
MDGKALKVPMALHLNQGFQCLLNFIPLRIHLKRSNDSRHALWTESQKVRAEIPITPNISKIDANLPPKRDDLAAKR